MRTEFAVFKLTPLLTALCSFADLPDTLGCRLYVYTDLRKATWRDCSKARCEVLRERISTLWRLLGSERQLLVHHYPLGCWITVASEKCAWKRNPDIISRGYSWHCRTVAISLDRYFETSRFSLSAACFVSYTGGSAPAYCTLTHEGLTIDLSVCCHAPAKVSHNSLY